MQPRVMDDRVQELCDGYVLGALEGEELEEMRELLARRDGPVRETVRKTMRNSEEAAALLAWGAPAATPPAGLRQRVLDAVEGDIVVDAERSEIGNEGSTRVLAMTTPARSSRFAWPLAGIGWAAAAALAIVVFLVNGRVQQVTRNLAEVQTEASGLRLEVANRHRVLAIIGSRDARSIRLVTTAPDAPQFRAYWSESAGLVLTGTGVAAPRAGRTMQLWIVPKQGMPISAGVFEPGAGGEVLLIASGRALNLPGPGQAQALAISDEPAGGSAQPTTMPAWVGAAGGF